MSYLWKQNVCTQNTEQRKVGVDGEAGRTELQITPNRSVFISNEIWLFSISLHQAVAPIGANTFKSASKMLSRDTIFYLSVFLEQGGQHLASGPQDNLIGPTGQLRNTKKKLFSN